MIFLASAIIPIAFNSQSVTTVTLVDTPHALSATEYDVTVEVFNELQAFNDDTVAWILLIIRAKVAYSHNRLGRNTKAGSIRTGF